MTKYSNTTVNTAVQIIKCLNYQTLDNKGPTVPTTVIHPCITSRPDVKRHTLKYASKLTVLSRQGINASNTSNIMQISMDEIAAAIPLWHTR